MFGYCEREAGDDSDREICVVVMESRQCDARHVKEMDEVHQLRMKVADSKGKCDINNYSALASTTLTS
jgi:hypothetical protein